MQRKIRINAHLIGLSGFLLAACLAFLAALWSVTAIEARTAQALRRALDEGGQLWARAETDGLLVRLSGMAPSEALRFRALSLAGSVVDGNRVRDEMGVAAPTAIAAPEFSVEILRNDEGISLIGLIPAETPREPVLEALGAMAAGGTVADMLESAAHPAPEGWQPALDFALAALKSLPRSKISVSASRVAITAITDSAAEKARIEADLARKKPAGMVLALDISAPRPVITPFTLRFLVDAGGARFDACSADTERARARILAAAAAAGMQGKAICTIGMGVPTPEWAVAAEMAIRAMGEMGAGSVTFSDADVALIAADTVAPADFDRIVGELDSNLPSVFSLHAVLTEKPKAEAGAAGPPEFTATLSPEGLVQLRGRLTDELGREAARNFARSRFGNDAVYLAARLDPDLPKGWPIRSLAALEALAELNSGTARVRPDLVSIEGVSGNEEASATISRLLALRLGEADEFRIDVRYEPKLDPLLGLPTAEQCVAEINGFLAAAKITFDSGAATIAERAAPTLDRIAERMADCGEFPMEVAGHTDSQGREEMNLALSKSRAQAVILALMDRRVLTGNLNATGYGETRPVAENETEAGREANRRIEFTLIGTEAKDEASQADLAVAGAEVPAEPAPAPLAPAPAPRPDADAGAVPALPAEDVPASDHAAADAVATPAAPATGEAAEAPAPEAAAATDAAPAAAPAEPPVTATEAGADTPRPRPRPPVPGGGG